MSELPATLFLQLLSSALFNKPADERLFRLADSSVWLKVINYGEAHKIVALLYDSVMMLPESVRPEKKIIYTLFFHADATEKLFARNAQALDEISEEYEKMNLSVVLLKGQSNAVCYPNPKRRSPGDIDLFFYRDIDYDKANAWATGQGFHMDSEHIHHQSFRYDKVCVENHRQVSYFEMRKYDRLLEQEVGKIVESNDFGYLEIEGRRVKILPLEFNAFFLFQHLFHHFIHLGVGMKQLCDWILFWNKHHTEIDENKFLKLAESFDLLYAMQVFASVAVKYLGANPSIFPFEIKTDEKYTDIVIKDILEGGNFGFDVFKNKKFKGELHRKLFSFAYTTNRIRKISGIAPHHIIPLPLIKLNKNIKLLLKK